MPRKNNIHASSVAIKGKGVLLLGESGSGKSDLTLRLIDEGASLIADDRTDVYISEGILRASPPVEISGMLEIREIGICKELDFQGNIQVLLAVKLVNNRDSLERLPENPQFFEYSGIRVPQICIYPFDISATAKIRFALENAFLDL